MIVLLKVHFLFLYTKKIGIITFFLIFITLLVSVYFSKVYLDYQELLFYKDTYLFAFLVESLGFIKIVILTFILFQTINNFIINKYDIYIIIRTSRIKALFSKIIITFLLNIFVGFVVILGVFILWLLTPFAINYSSLFISFAYFNLFIIYYSVLFLSLHVIFRHLYVFIIPFLGFLISTLSIDYGLKIDEISTFSKVINLVFPDLIVLDNTFVLIYSIHYYIGVIFILIITLIRIPTNKDLDMCE